MYRKSMRSALEEARAYSAVNEVKVSKGGKTLNISKKDVEVYQAKGWSLQEANMKRILQALQDKLSDEGGAAGFDDLKKTAKSMGLNLTPAMLKDMPGIKQHRDGDYILEAIVGNPNLTHFLFTYKEPGGLFGNRTQMKKITAKDQSAATSEFKRMKPKAKMMSVKKLSDLHDDLEEVTAVYTDKKTRQVKSKKFKDINTAKDYFRKTGEAAGQITYKEETELEEAFTRKDFQELETTNDHTEAAKKLINMFGTDQEKKTMADIERRHEKTGYISGTDYKMRQIMVNKYFSRLK